MNELQTSPSSIRTRRLLSGCLRATAVRVLPLACTELEDGDTT